MWRWWPSRADRQESGSVVSGAAGGLRQGGSRGMEERTTLGGRWAGASPVRRSMRPMVWAVPGATIGEAAHLLDGAEHSCVLVRLPGGLGIATDNDFRASLADASLSREAPLSAICSVPAVTV